MSVLKPYPSYKDSGVEWIGSVPCDWDIKRLKHLFTEKKHTFNPKLNSGAISFGKVVFKDDEKITVETKSSYQEVLTGEFLVNPLNLNYDLRSLRIALSQIDVVVSAGYIVLLAEKSLNSTYFSYLLHIYDVQEMKLLGSGIRQTINFKDIGNSFLPLPPLVEQKTIAAHLDKETARIDTLISKKERFIELLKEKRSSLISHALAQDISIKDKPYRLRHLIKLNPGKSEAGHLPDNLDVTFLPMEAINNGLGGINDLAQIKQLQEVGGSYTYFAEGDVLLAKVTPCFENGKKAHAINLRNGIGFGTSEVHVLRSGKKLLPEYLMLLLSSSRFKAEGCASMTGTGGLKRVSDKAVLDFSFHLPTKEEQQKIVSYLGKQTARIDTLIEKINQSITLLKERRSALITAAVTGKIDLRGEA